MTVDLTPGELIIIRVALEQRLHQCMKFASDCEKSIGSPVRPTDDPTYWRTKADETGGILVKLGDSSR